MLESPTARLRAGLGADLVCIGFSLSLPCRLFRKVNGLDDRRRAEDSGDRGLESHSFCRGKRGQRKIIFTGFHLLEMWYKGGHTDDA